MRRLLEITRRELDAAGLRRESSRCGNGRAARRMLAVAMLMEGAGRAEVARLCGTTNQSLCDWINRYNASGTAGLFDQPRCGPPRKLTDAQMEELRDLVVAGPDVERDGVVRWRCADLRRQVEERHQVRVHERTIGKWLRGLRMTRLRPRPSHPKRDEAAQEAFKKTSRTS